MANKKTRESPRSNPILLFARASLSCRFSFFIIHPLKPTSTRPWLFLRKASPACRGALSTREEDTEARVGACAVLVISVHFQLSPNLGAGAIGRPDLVCFLATAFRVPRCFFFFGAAAPSAVWRAVEARVSSTSGLSCTSCSAFAMSISSSASSSSKNSLASGTSLPLPPPVVWLRLSSPVSRELAILCIAKSMCS
jgi:hypothetical protein